MSRTAGHLFAGETAELVHTGVKTSWQPDTIASFGPLSFTFASLVVQQGLGGPGKGLGGPAGLPNGAGFPPNGLPPGLAGFYPPAGLAAAATGWGALPLPDDRAAAEQQHAQAPPPGFSVPSHGKHRIPRCASHVYIAHFIEYQSKLDHQRQV